MQCVTFVLMAGGDTPSAAAKAKGFTKHRRVRSDKYGDGEITGLK